MKITYYGTGAGEGIPGVFCNCPICAEALKRGGKNIRTRSQALINDDLLIDFPPDINMHRLVYGLNVPAVKTLLFTHSHADHLLQAEMESLLPHAAHTFKHMDIYGNEAVRDKIQAVVKDLNRPDLLFTFHVVHANETFSVPGYTIHTLRATHAPSEEALFYMIEQNGKFLVYAHDTYELTDDNIAQIKKFTNHIDFISMDCTSASKNSDHYHMGFPNNVRQKKRLIDIGLADETTVFVSSHFSHNGLWLHEDLEEAGKKAGIVAAYDTLSIEI